MSEEIKQAAESTAPAAAPAPAEAPVAAPAPTDKPAPRGARPAFGAGGRGGRGGAGGRGAGGARGGRRDNRRGRGDVPAEADYEEKNVEVARVTRVTKGGKRMRFRVLSVIGNRKGRTGFGLAKGVDVAGASNKASTQARKSLITVPLVNETIPHAVTAKYGAAMVLLKPAPKGSGVKAGGAVRIVLELAGIPNVVSKILGSNNKTNNVKATFEALRMLRLPVKTEKSEESAVAKK